MVLFKFLTSTLDGDNWLVSWLAASTMEKETSLYICMLSCLWYRLWQGIFLIVIFYTYIFSLQPTLWIITCMAQLLMWTAVCWCFVKNVAHTAFLMSFKFLWLLLKATPQYFCSRPTTAFIGGLTQL